MAARPKIVVTEEVYFHSDAREILDEFADVEYLQLPSEPSENRSALQALIAEKDINALVVRINTACPADVIETAAPKGLKVVATVTAGYNHICKKALEEHGMKLITLGGSLAHTIPTAELVLSLMLAVSRQVVQSHTNTSAGAWERSLIMGHTLYGKTLGIVGLGAIGQYVAGLARAFRMNIIAYDPYQSPETFLTQHATQVDSVDEVVQQADFLTLHCLLTDETRHIINAERIAMMKPTAYLINCGRGPLVDEAALIEALATDSILGAAVDVFETEPLTEDDPMAVYARDHNNLIVTAHIGASTYEAKRDGSIVVANRLRDYFQENPLSEQ